MYGDRVFWRETMMPAKFLIFDSRVVLVIIPFFLHMRLWTLVLTIIVMFVFWWFDGKGVPANAILRFARSWMIGKKRSARGVFEERTAIDFGFESRLYLENLKNEELARSTKTGGSLLERLGLARARHSPEAEAHSDADSVEQGLKINRDDSGAAVLPKVSRPARIGLICSRGIDAVRSLTGKRGVAKKSGFGVKMETGPGSEAGNGDLTIDVKTGIQFGLSGAGKEFSANSADACSSAEIRQDAHLHTGFRGVMRKTGRALKSCLARFGRGARPGRKSNGDDSDG